MGFVQQDASIPIRTAPIAVKTASISPGPLRRQEAPGLFYQQSRWRYLAPMVRSLNADFSFAPTINPYFSISCVLSLLVAKHINPKLAIFFLGRFFKT